MTPNTIYCDVDEVVSRFVRPFIAFARANGVTIADYENWSDVRGGLPAHEFYPLLWRYEKNRGYERQSVDTEARDSLWRLFFSGRYINYITLRSSAHKYATRSWIVDAGLPMGEVIMLGPGGDKVFVIDARRDALLWIDDMIPPSRPESCEAVLVPRPWNTEAAERRLTWAAIVREFRA